MPVGVEAKIRAVGNSQALGISQYMIGDEQGYQVRRGTACGHNKLKKNKKLLTKVSCFPMLHLSTAAHLVR